MITWIIYIIVGFILLFVLYLALLGINRGVEAKNINRAHKINNVKKKQKNVTSELAKLKKLYDDGVINKKEFNLEKKKLLS